MNAKKQRQFDDNISRLVKTTNDSQRPSDKFTDELIGKALEHLEEPKAQPREEKNKMTAQLRVIKAIAAMVAIICGLMIFQAVKNSGLSPKTDKTTFTNKTPAKAEKAAPKPASEAADPKATFVANNIQTTVLKPIPFKLPKAMFVGTPENIEGVIKLEKPRGKPRPPFLAPVGTVNVAFEKPVTGSESDPIMGELDQITDGDKEAADGSYVELGPFQQYVTIDLEADYNIYAILAWHFHKQARVYFDVIVQVSTDKDFVHAVIIFNNDHDNSEGFGVGKDLHYVETNEGRLIDAKGVRGRYVRLYSTGNNANDLNHYTEVEVFGMPAGAMDLFAKAETELKPIDTKLPKPNFVGTPANMQTGRLEKLKSPPTKPVTVPKEGNVVTSYSVSSGDKSGEIVSLNDSLHSVSPPVSIVAGIESADTRGSVTSRSTTSPSSSSKYSFGSGRGLGTDKFGLAKKMAPLAEQQSQSMAHGGSTTVNGEGADAMFFKNYGVNPFIDTEDDHLSTFATDVDTGSYTVCRRYLNEGNLPPNEAVRVEEFVNYFKYNYPVPGEDMFAVYADAVPWQLGNERKNTYLLRIGLKAFELQPEHRKPAVLTFVIDISGSMNRENRLGLVKRSLRMLVDQLNPDDMIGIAVYGSKGQVIMEHRPLSEKDEIVSAIESLRPGGSTNAEEGIRLGYDMAERSFKKGWINRVLLCSDGVANVGRTSHDEIFKMIKGKADKGVTLSTLGFGMGNYNDVLMERLGDKGNGYYSYIDTFEQAQKLFGENLTGALQVVARDVKVQVDFNPEIVKSYRLIGYENRDVPDDKFRDDKYDGGEVGAGHSVTALYEIKLHPEKAGKIATTFLRFKDADTFEVTEVAGDILTSQIHPDFEAVSNDMLLAATVTEFAEILRESFWAKGASLDTTIEKSNRLLNANPGDKDISELHNLIVKAKNLIDKKKATEAPETAEDSGNTQIELLEIDK